MLILQSLVTQTINSFIWLLLLDLETFIMADYATFWNLVFTNDLIICTKLKTLIAEPSETKNAEGIVRKLICIFLLLFMYDNYEQYIYEQSYSISHNFLAPLQKSKQTLDSLHYGRVRKPYITHHGIRTSIVPIIQIWADLVLCRL